MPPFHDPRREFMSLAVATVALLAGCDDCPERSCGPRAFVRLNLPAAASGATVMACHVDVCATATLPAAAAPGSSAELSFPLSDVEGSLVTRADGSLQLIVHWWAAANRDRYTTVFRDAAGAELAALDAMAIFPAASLSSGACHFCPGTTLGDPA